MHYKDPQHQGRLEKVLRSIFPIENIVAHSEASIKNPSTSQYLEVDVWFPELQICFEYQDDYHYQATWYSHVPLSTVQDAKRNFVLQRGETLILVPCWWDGSLASLQATIKFHRPDLLPDHRMDSVLLVPSNPSFGFFAGIPTANQLMLASFPSTAEVFVVTNENSWWLGEKYDGIRCFWNPIEKQLYSRHGVMINAPPSQNLFGDVVLDGEIWCGRGLFLDTQLIIQSTDRVNWPFVKVVCFDEASRGLKGHPFEKRYAVILSHFVSSHPSLQHIIDGGGEGVILRRPQSLYESGRAASLLKLKAARGDQEALVSSVGADNALLLQLPDGTFFKVTKEDCDLHRQPVRGDIVTFAHDYQTRRSAPANPVVYRIREDLTWEDVVKSSSETVGQFLNEPHQNMQNYAPKPRGYWSYDQGKNMRLFLEILATKMGFDPLVADNWYSISRQSFVQHKEVRAIIRYYNYNLISALVDLFPELNLEVSKFHSTPRTYWDSVKNRRALYERFAVFKGANPLDPNFWYTLAPEELRKFKGGKTAVQYYKGYVESVIHLFPEIHFKTKLFTQRTVSSWVDVSKRRAFFDRFAQVKGFDPLVPANWYIINTNSFNDFQGYEAILKYYGGKLSECLIQLYPDIGLQKSKFNILSYWQYAENRREALLHFAKVHNFDPLVPDNWYQQSMSEFSSFAETRSMLYFYNRSYVRALVELFPNICLDPYKFVNIPRDYWADLKNRRALFTKIAHERGFDPLLPSNWYPISTASLLNVKGVAPTLNHYHKKSLPKALIDMFPEIGLVESKFHYGI